MSEPQFDDDILGELFDNINNLAEGGDFTGIDRMLAELDINHPDPAMLTGILSYSFRYRNLLSEWREAVSRVVDELQRRGEDVVWERRWLA